MLPGMSAHDAHRSPAANVDVRAAPASLRRQAMALALGCDNGPASESIIDRAFAQGQRDGEDWRGLLIARVVTPDAVAATGAATAAQRERGPLVGAILARILAGNVASVGVPRVTVDAPEGTDALLATHAVRFARQERAAFAQTLLEDDARSATALTAAGFAHVADLVFLVAKCDGAGPNEPDARTTTAASQTIEWLTYRPELHRRLANLVERTYVDSRDCPELDGLRPIDDVLAGYRATGDFSPERWLIATQQGRDIGCLLLTDHPEDDQWELIYVGVAPEFRGRGLGVVLTRHALALARRAGRRHVVLAVDAANEPALAMYRAAGFEPWERRSIFLRRFDKPREM